MDFELDISEDRVAKLAAELLVKGDKYYPFDAKNIEEAIVEQGDEFFSKLAAMMEKPDSYGIYALIKNATESYWKKYADTQAYELVCNEEERKKADEISTVLS